MIKMRQIMSQDKQEYCLDDVVVYKGEKYWIYKLYNNGYVALAKLDERQGSWVNTIYVKQSEIKKERGEEN